MKVRALILAVLLAASLVMLLSHGGSSDLQMPITTDSEVARGHFLHGRMLYEKLRNQEAGEQFELAVAEDSRFALAYFYLSRVHASPKGALNNLARAVSLSESVSEGERLLIQAGKAAASQELAKQLRFLEELTAKFPNDARIHSELATYFFQQREWELAADRFLKAVELDPSFPWPHNGLGYCYRFLGSYPAAERSFLSYMALIPDDPNPHDSYGDLLTIMNRHEEALASYRKAIEIQPDFISSNLGVAHNLCRSDKYDEALAQLEQLLELSGDDGMRRAALAGMAVSLIDKGDLTPAIDKLKLSYRIAEAALDTSAMASDLDFIGQIYLQAGDAEEASRVFTRSMHLVVESSPYPTVTELAQKDHTQRMALVWMHRGNLDQARAYAAKYQAQVAEMDDPARVKLAHQTLGRIALESGDYSGAIRELTQADTEQAYNQYYLGLAHESAGNKDQSLALFHEASTFDQFNRLTQAFVRLKALKKIDSLRMDPGEGLSKSGS